MRCFLINVLFARQPQAALGGPNRQLKYPFYTTSAINHLRAESESDFAQWFVSLCFPMLTKEDLQ